MLTAFLMTALLAGELPIEAPLLPGAVALEEEGRYRSARTYQETLDYYKRVFRRTGGIRWRNIVNLPGIKAKNVQSLRKKTHWEGLNIYEMRGEVRIFVLKREQTKPPKPKS